MSDDKKTFFNMLPDALKNKAKELAAQLLKFKTEMADPNPPSMTEGKLKDGTPIKFVPGPSGGLEAGCEVIIVTQDGEVPAPEGDLILEDGSTVTVKKEGDKSIVSAVKPAEQAMETEAKDLADVKERVTKIVEKFEAQFAAQEKLNKAQKIEIENLKLKLGKQTVMIADNTEMIMAFGEVETHKAIETPEVGKSKKEIAIQKLTQK